MTDQPPQRRRYPPPPPRRLTASEIARGIFHIATVSSFLIALASLVHPTEALILHSGGTAYGSTNKTHPIDFYYLFLELEHDGSKPDGAVVYWILIVPHWWIAIFAGILPLCWISAFLLRRARKRLRCRKPGCCPTCGYDLRATPERCPECGWTGEKPASEPLGSGTSA
jgi:hypothetical protein